MRQFAPHRAALQPDQVRTIFEHFSQYDFTSASPEFFGPWRQLLDDLHVGTTRLRFDNGGICAVDLIKCPTTTAWGTYVRQPHREGHEVWAHCHQHNDRIGHGFLVQQLTLHQPTIVIRPGTALNGPGMTKEHLGSPDRNLNAIIPHRSENYVTNVRTKSTPRRLTIELRGARDLKTIAANTDLLARARSTLQDIVNAWATTDQTS